MLTGWTVFAFAILGGFGAYIGWNAASLFFFTLKLFFLQR